MSDSLQTQERTAVIYDCLSHSHRRYVLRCLKEAGESLALADLAETIADWETETPRADIADEATKDVYMSLYHNHVPRLADANFVRYDQEDDVVELLECPEELWNDERYLAIE